MRSALRLLAALGLASGIVTSACASESQGWYFGGQVGVNAQPNMKFKNTALKSTDSEEADLGYGVNGAVGYDFGGLRTEAELGWRQNGASKIGGVKADGNVNVATLMANVYFDIALGLAVTPYVGLGVGAANVSANDLKRNGTKLYSSDQTLFAGQTIIGASYPLTESLSLNADYRYLRTLEGSFARTGSTTKSRSGYTSHAVMVGFSYKFNEGPATAEKTATPMTSSPMLRAPQRPAEVTSSQPQQPAAVMVRSYLIFFDFDKADLTPEAEKIVSQAATNAAAQKVTNLRLVGHTDTTGSEKYNMALSLRRANVVKAALVRQGIPANQIAVVGKGKSEPLVPTADGVREPQNRRVQIILP